MKRAKTGDSGGGEASSSGIRSSYEQVRSGIRSLLAPLVQAVMPILEATEDGGAITELCAQLEHSCDLAAQRIDQRESVLGADRTALAEEVRSMEAHAGAQDEVVRLNVGGTYFTTTLSTLRADPNSMLGAMFSGRHAVPKHDDNSTFIDRDPTHFRHVLNFLRTGAEALPQGIRAPRCPADEERRNELRLEASYYQVHGMLRALGADAVERLKRCVAAGGKIKEDEDRLRDAILQGGDAAARLLGSGMVDIAVDLETHHNLFVCNLDGPLAPDTTIVLGSRYRGWRHRLGSAPSASAVTPAVFRENLRVFTLGALSNLNWDGLVCAGGAVLGCLLPTPTWAQASDKTRLYYFMKAATAENVDDEWEIVINGKALMTGAQRYPDDEEYASIIYEKVEGQTPACGFEVSDVDLFLVGLSREQAVDKIRHVYATLKAAWGGQDKDIFVLRTKFAVTFIGNWPRRRVQIILRLYRSVEEVLCGFDIDACCVAWTGSRVVVLQRALRAINTGVNLVDPSRRSSSYELRLCKYALRGFAVAVPAYDPARLASANLRLKTADKQGLARLLAYSDFIEQRQLELPHIFGENHWYRFVSRLHGEESTKAVLNTGDAVGPGPVYDKRAFGGDYDNPMQSKYLCFSAFHSGGLHYAAAEMVDNFVRRQRRQGKTVDFGYSRRIDPILNWPEGRKVKTLINSTSHFGFGPRSLTELATTLDCGELAFITIDPGRQYTGSFRPDDRDWYAQAYGEEET